MAEFIALDGLEYDDVKAGPLDGVLSPPYDVVDEPLRRTLSLRSPYNIVHLILPQAGAGRDAYQAAAAILQDWRGGGVLRPAGRALYLLEQDFEVSGRRLVRTALLGRIRLSPWREGGVYPHEVTLPKPKADRLNLYRATHVQPGPVFALFEDRQGAAAALAGEVKAAGVRREVDGPEGAHDRIWKVTDARTIALFEKAMVRARFFIADGHHRYETALAYREELAAGRRLPDDHPANFIMTAAVPFGDPGLVILPTHRLVKAAGRDVESAVQSLREDYDVALSDASRVEAVMRPSASTIALYAAGQWRVLTLKKGPREALVAEAGRLMADLNVYEARRLVLSRFFDDVDEAVAREKIRYTHEIAEAVSRVDSGEFDAGVVLAPVSVEVMAAVAAEGLTMPPKSTYFYPKIPTGVALNPLG